MCSKMIVFAYIKRCFYNVCEKCINLALNITNNPYENIMFIF